MNRLARLLCVWGLFAVFIPWTSIQAQEDARFFPETGYSVEGRFLEYWNENGGLPVFGFPLSEAFYAVNSSNDYVLTQYFERQRFEWHPANERPYDVLLGRLGAELSTTEPPVNSEPACYYFEDTGHNVCDQLPGLGFLNYWNTHGLEFGHAGISFDESLALFGFPISEAAVETNSSGDTVLTQWFERARLEWHPDNPEQFMVLGGRLGAELIEAQGLPARTSQIRIALIEIEGGDIGCNDGISLVERNVESSAAPLHAAFTTLLNHNEQIDAQTGLYNALYLSDLEIESIMLDDAGVATIQLVGEMGLGGLCDGPRFVAQLTQTALQFPSVTQANIFINDQPLEDVLNGRGGR